MKVIKFFKKYWKATIVWSLLIALAYFAVMGWDYTDRADTPFWWKAWIVIALVCLVAFILIIRWLVKNKKDW